ncbi:unnamed protein product [Paramecium octaurelia]|uniref:Uncharacterized protein n=1 Tax=Paramecium octaurelia TaxID=43137 RepID=A0A8S1XLQ7_PAROT|nr:unnamed protein product [Paramecium octaurelia]
MEEKNSHSYLQSQTQNLEFKREIKIGCLETKQIYIEPQGIE